MNEHPIDGLMKTAMESIKEMIDVNTIVGDPVQTDDGTVIIPVSRVSFGFAAGGGEYNINQDEKKAQGEELFPFAGGSGAGVSVQPVAFMVVGKNNGVKLIEVNNKNAMNKLIDFLPTLMDKIENSFDEKGTKAEISEKNSPKYI